ncbi:MULTISPECIES: hypothetical protein [Pseudomonas]|uniref:hypothetical protein n=1 Tax=Pseudomonas TaxID=286 RepID=UPI001C0A8245|nr:MULTISPECIES: hypothetical protein [Pseudomonas]MCK3839938.1 hypothetical protein [Pseudomonas sp. NCIMB 10586]VCU63541.1 hypothetical protein [Pseudomonas synxantha]
MSNDNAASYVIAAGPRNTDELDYRAKAVAAAIEIIRAKASGADATSLKVEFGNLSLYADQIQAALKVK